MYNKSGLKYFLYNTTKNKKIYLELPEDIRKHIWKYAHTYPYLNCYVCDKVLITLNINIERISNIENYSIVNGLSKCSDCFID